MFDKKISLVDNIMKTFKEYDQNILEHYYDEVEGFYTIHCDHAIVLCYDEGKIVKVSFHVSTRPDESASIILILNSIDEIDEISLMEIHSYTKDLKIMLSGDEAITTQKEKEKDRIINEFMKEQRELHILANYPVGPMC